VDLRRFFVVANFRKWLLAELGLKSAELNKIYAETFIFFAIYGKISLDRFSQLTGMIVVGGGNSEKVYFSLIIYYDDARKRMSD
jgi:hypothetical protein